MTDNYNYGKLFSYIDGRVFMFIEYEEKKRTEDWDMSELHYHECYELYFLEQGEREIILENKAISVKPNTLLIIPPFIMHKTKGGAYHRFIIYVSADLLQNSPLANIKDACAFCLNEEYSQTVFSVLKFACEIERTDKVKKDNEKLSILNTVLAILEHRTMETLSFSQTNIKNDGIFKIVNYINEHYDERYNLNALCKKFYFTKSNLCRCFKKEMDCSVTDYVYFVRLNKAKNLLYNTDKSIEEIASACGFSSANYFSLMFKRKIGTSPMAYRRTR